MHDNEALSTASSESLSMLPVFLLDPRDFGRSPSSGFDRTGPFRAAFLLESVKDLRNSLRARGSDLVVRVGRPETVLPELAKAVGADGVFAHREVLFTNQWLFVIYCFSTISNFLHKIRYC